MRREKNYAARIGNQIKKLRLSKRLSQFDLAEKAGIGASYMSKIEQGRRFPSVKTSIRIAKALGVEVSELFNCGGLPLPGAALSRDQLELISILEKLGPEEVRLLLEVAKKLKAR